MRIIDHRPQEWFLAEHDGELFLDVNCNHGAAGFSVLVRLTPEQAARYAATGAAAADEFSRGVQNMGPHAFELDVGRELNARMYDAIMNRQAAEGPRPS